MNMDGRNNRRVFCSRCGRETPACECLTWGDLLSILGISLLTLVCGIHTFCVLIGVH